MQQHWDLDPTVDFLNHGSFGAAPRVVLEAQRSFQREMEAEPVLFLDRLLPNRLEQVYRKLGEFLQADMEGLGLIGNATSGVNAILRSLDWKEGDELVIADHGYGAVLLTLEYLKKRYKIQVRKAIVPLPLQDTAEITEAFARAITPATKLLIVDHITSASALIFPVEAILELAHSKGIPVLVDGAHAPGMLSLKLKELGADFYTGNLHKWVCAPKGCAFIYVAPAWREQIEPGAISHFYGKSLPERFGWTGTFDPSAWLSIPAALEFWENHGWDREGNYRLVQVGRQELAEVLKQPLPHPDSPSLYGSMAVVPFPWGNGKNLRELTHRLYAEHQIEVPFTSYDGRCWLRISGMRYNHASQYTRLASILGGGWGQ